jgi:hypothetical protein
VNQRTPLVFITNLGAHDYEPAKKYGELRFLTRGKIRRYSTSTIYREFIEGMADAESTDHLLVSSLSILNSIASAILSRRFGIINFLLYSDGRYISRSVNIDALLTNGGHDDEDLRTNGEEGRLRSYAPNAEDDEG